MTAVAATRRDVAPAVQPAEVAADVARALASRDAAAHDATAHDVTADAARICAPGMHEARVPDTGARETGIGGGIRIEGPLHARRYSLIFRATLAGGEALAVKYCLDPATGVPDPATARRQYTTLERAWRAVPSDGACRLPRPIALSEAQAMVLTEWIAGEPMTRHLMSLRTRASRMLDLVTRAGAWLRAFHAARPLAARPLDLSAMRQGLAVMHRSPVWPHASVQAAVAALRGAADAAQRDPLPTSWLHGDFKMDNLLVARDALFGIDVEILYENAVVLDLCAFVNHLELTLDHPRALRWRPARSRLVDAFLTAYDPALLARSRLPFAWMSLYFAIGDWEEFAARRNSSLRHRYQQASYAALVRRRTAALRREVQLSP